nr:SRPBCC family protein [Nocardia cerradoensis]
MVWAALADHEGMSDWSPGVTVTLERDGDLERNGVGAVRCVRGPGIVLREEVTGYERDRWLAYRLVSGLPLRGYRGEVFLSRCDEETAITWTLMCENRSALVRFGLGLYANIFINALVRTARRGTLVRK